MATTSSLLGEDLAALLELTGDADSVELKLTMPESAQRWTAAALQLDPLDAETRQSPMISR